MKKWIMNLLGINKIIEESQKQTKILEKIHEECKRNSDLVQSYNKAYHINTY